jgi:sulfofructose kinase
LTDGENGSYWLDLDGKCVEHTPTPQVDVLDTNGAGDVFHGAISLALLETEKPRLAIQFASSAAALKCTEYGGRLGAPDRTSTLRLMKETYNATI